MRPIARVILPVLALLLMASSASAQDMPDIVRVEVNATWSGLPSQPGPVNLTGTWLYHNTGPNIGYLITDNPLTNWAVTGEVPIGNAQRVGPYFLAGNSANPDFRLEAFWQNQQTHLFLDGGITTITVSFGTNGPTLLPGDYALSARYGSDVPFGGGTTTGGFPTISGYQRVVAVPELALLRSFTKRLGGQRFNDLVNPTLQRVTAWGAAKLLGATSRGVYVVLPTKILEVQEWCSGVASMKWLMLLALALGLVGRMSVPWMALFVVAAALIGLEANILRVAGIGIGFAKDSTAWGSMGLGTIQVIGLGRLAARRRR